MAARKQKQPKTREPITIDGTAYAVQRELDPRVQRFYQDDIAVRVLTRAFERIELGSATALDVDLASSFVARLDDGTLVDDLVFVSNVRANALIALVQRYGRPDIGFRRELKRARTPVPFEDMIGSPRKRRT